MQMTQPTVRPVIDDSLYIAQGIDALPPSYAFRFFKPDPQIHYLPLCDDFGPMNMICVTAFAAQLNQELAEFEDGRLIYCVDDDKRSLTNAVFLLGSYLILIRDSSVDDVVDCFSWLEAHQYEEYRDATFSKPTFRLSLADCWCAVAKGVQLGWVGRPDADGFCGLLDMREYAHYDDPLNGDLHEVVPGKLIAFVGPHDLGGGLYRDDASGRRVFSASYFADELVDRGAAAVVRLNEAHYDGAAFTDRGLAFIDLPFDDCTAPPPAVAEAFLAAVASARGPVAVHCKAGLGRTGTLIGLYLMRSCGFTAREAIGWLRIMRPGCVIGEQQGYLCRVEAAVACGRDWREPRPEDDVAGAGRGEPSRLALELGEEVWAGTGRRGAAQLRRRSSLC